MMGTSVKEILKIDDVVGVVKDWLKSVDVWVTPVHDIGIKELNLVTVDTLLLLELIDCSDDERVEVMLICRKGSLLVRLIKYCNNG